MLIRLASGKCRIILTLWKHILLAMQENTLHLKSCGRDLTHICRPASAWCAGDHCAAVKKPFSHSSRLSGSPYQPSPSSSHSLPTRSFIPPLHSSSLLLPRCSITPGPSPLPPSLPCSLPPSHSRPPCLISSLPHSSPVLLPLHGLLCCFKVFTSWPGEDKNLMRSR